MNIQLSWKDRLLFSSCVNKKIKAFQALGYSSVTEEEVWDFLLNYCWKKQIPIGYSEKKHAILSVEPNAFFDYQRLKAQTVAPAQFDWAHLEDLL